MLRSPLNSYGLVPGIQRGVLWDADNYWKIKMFFWYLKAADYDYLNTKVEELDDMIDARWNDHKNVKFNAIEPLDVAKNHNAMTYPGMGGWARILAKQSDKYFLYVGIGTGTTPPGVGQNQMVAPIARVSVDQDGALSARGNVLVHVGNFGYGVPTADVFEVGIFDDPIEGDMMSRSVFSNALQHTQNQTFVTCSHSAIMIPIAEEMEEDE